MIIHPTIFILCAIALLLVSYRYEKAFKLLAVIFPVVLLKFVFDLEENELDLTLANITFKAKFENYTILIAYAFTVMLFVANCYAVLRRKKYEILLGSAYVSFAYMALFAGDLLSLLVAIELKMVMSSAIIFVGGYRQSLRSAKKYFLTHLMSGNMIVIGISYIYMRTGSMELTNITDMMIDPSYSTVILSVMLTGLLMNIASFPFSGWMVNYYPAATPAGFVYLLVFSTKVSVIILMKFFAGYALLKVIATIMIVYACVKAIIESNLFSLLCLLSIIQMGFMTLGIADGSESMQIAVTIYLFMHILYKGLLALATAVLMDHGKIDDCNALKRIKSPAMIFAIVVSLLAMLNMPLTSTMIAKSYVTHDLRGEFAYYLVIFLGMMTAIAVPWKRYFRANDTVIIHLQPLEKALLYGFTLLVFVITFFGGYIPFFAKLPTFKETILFSADSMKQLTILASAIAFVFFVKRPRIHSPAINLTEHLGDALFYMYKHLEEYEKSKDEKEPWSLISLESQVFVRMRSVHNQQTAIFIVFSIFIIMLVTFLVKGS